MIQATTPPITLIIRGVDLTTVESVHVTIKQGGTTITLTGDDIVVTSSLDGNVSVSEITFYLTQTQSIKFLVGDAKIQVNWMYEENGKILRNATVASSIFIDEQLLNEVIEDE